MAHQATPLDRVLTEFPPLIKYFADRLPEDLIDAVESVGRLSQAADHTWGARAPLHQNLQLLQCPLKELGRASPYLLGALKLIFTAPFDLDTAPKLIRGDFINLVARGRHDAVGGRQRLLTGTGFSGVCAHWSSPTAATRRR